MKVILDMMDGFPRYVWDWKGSQPCFFHMKVGKMIRSLESYVGMMYANPRYALFGTINGWVLRSIWD